MPKDSHIPVLRIILDLSSEIYRQSLGAKSPATRLELRAESFETVMAQWVYGLKQKSVVDFSVKKQVER